MKRLEAPMTEEADTILQSVTDPKLIFSSLLIRLGVLIVAIYLVQILINLYRYNARTAASYQALSDSLMFPESDSEQVRLLHDAFLPDVGFGRSPRPMSENIAETFAKGVSRLRRKNGRNGEEAAERTSQP